MFPAASVPVSLTPTVKALCPWGGARELQPKMLLSANMDRQTDVRFLSHLTGSCLTRR